MPQIDTHLKGGCFSCLGSFSSSFSLSFFSPWFFIFPSISWHLETQNGPPKGDTLPESQFEDHRKNKNVFFSAERSPLHDSSGSTKSRLEDHHATPKMRPECGPWTGSLVGPEPAFKLVILGSFVCFPHVAWNPYFYSVFVQIPI